jgi:hypothetical protein
MPPPLIPDSPPLIPESPKFEKNIEPIVKEDDFALNYFFKTNVQGNCETQSGTKGYIGFSNDSNKKLEYKDYGASIRFPNGEIYNNRCFILSLAHVLKIDVCEFYGNIIKILYGHVVPPQYDRIIELRNMNIDQLNKYAGDANKNNDMRNNAGELANYKTEKQIIMSTGSGGRNDYIDGSLLLKYFNFSDLLPNGLIILLTKNKIFNMDTEIYDGLQWQGVYIRPTNRGLPTIDAPIIYNFDESHFVQGKTLSEIMNSEDILNSIIARCQDITDLMNNAPFKYTDIVNSMREKPLHFPPDNLLNVIRVNALPPPPVKKVMTEEEECNNFIENNPQYNTHFTKEEICNTLKRVRGNIKRAISALDHIIEDSKKNQIIDNPVNPPVIPPAIPPAIPVKKKAKPKSYEEIVNTLLDVFIDTELKPKRPVNLKQVNFKNVTPKIDEPKINEANIGDDDIRRGDDRYKDVIFTDDPNMKNYDEWKKADEELATILQEEEDERLRQEQLKEGEEFAKKLQQEEINNQRRGGKTHKKNKKIINNKHHKTHKKDKKHKSYKTRKNRANIKKSYKHK